MSGDASVADGSTVTVDSFNKALDSVLSWLDEANDTISKQSPVANDIESLKEQFHHHEVCFILLHVFGIKIFEYVAKYPPHKNPIKQKS